VSENKTPSVIADLQGFEKLEVTIKSKSLTQFHSDHFIVRVAIIINTTQSELRHIQFSLSYSLLSVRALYFTSLANFYSKRVTVL